MLTLILYGNKQGFTAFVVGKLSEISYKKELENCGDDLENPRTDSEIDLAFKLV